MEAIATEFPCQDLIKRTRFVMTPELVDRLLQGHKRTTIRFDENGIEYPAHEILPVYAVGRGRPHKEARCVAEVAITSIRYTRFNDLSAADAEADGFPSRSDLIEALLEFYPTIKPDSILCVYTFAVKN
ncbi:ASCH domain-containing protein [Methylorubrum thiocyanatum]|uniref:ASCH domain-containing protein n=1 Tax=Methylorubrum thiocyanatum TaxID=47958 RepID=UPI00383A32B8